ncbi:MAG TPA: TolC family protein [Bacteroidetes bacterium]|nr:TolC family protein [Bacteroidota bacterium]
MKHLFFLIIAFLSANIYAQNNLDYFVNKALKNSPLLQKQNNENKILDLDIKLFEKIYNSPTVSLNANVIFAPIISTDNNNTKFELASAGANNYYGYDLGASNGGQYQALISVNQPLFTKKYLEAQKSKITILKEKYENQVVLTKLELKQAVTHQYILCIQSKKSIDNAIEINDILQTQIDEMKPLVNAGIFKYIDLKWIEIALKNNKVEQERLKIEYQSNVNALNLLCGVETNKIADLEFINLQLSNPLQTNSVFSNQYKLDSLMVQSDQKIANLKYLPQVNAFGDLGLNATYLPRLNRLGFSVGIGLNWNLFDGHHQKLKEQQNQIKLENLQYDKAYFVHQNTIRKNNLLSQMQSLDKQLVLINQQLKDYQDLLKLYQVELKEGLVSVLELKTVIKEIALQKQAKTNLKLSKQVIINAYNYWNH